MSRAQQAGALGRLVPQLEQRPNADALGLCALPGRAAVRVPMTNSEGSRALPRYSLHTAEPAVPGSPLGPGAGGQ